MTSASSAFTTSFLFLLFLFLIILFSKFPSTF
jgi:hypothetical protein